MLEVGGQAAAPLGSHAQRMQHRADTAAAIERYAARSRALREAEAAEAGPAEAGAEAGGAEAEPGADDQATVDAAPTMAMVEAAVERQRRARADLHVVGRFGVNDDRAAVDLAEAEGVMRARRQRAEHRDAIRAGGALAPGSAVPGYGGVRHFGDRPPPNCPAQAVMCWMGCQLLILMDIVRVPTNCVSVAGREECISCDIGADLSYSACGLPWPGPLPQQMPEGPGSYAEMPPLPFHNMCCTAHPECCDPITGPSERPNTALGESADGYLDHGHDVWIGKSMVKGVPCCDAFCGAHTISDYNTPSEEDGDSTRGPSSEELEAAELAENFYCDGYTWWYLSYVGVYAASVIVVANAAKNDGSTSACLTLAIGVIILYWVRTRIVPWATNGHTIVYPAGDFFEYAVMSDLFLWMMTRRARALRLHYERTSRHIDRVNDLEAARQRDRDELERAALQLAQRPVEPLPAVKPIEYGAVGAIVEGITMDDVHTDDRFAMNPIAQASIERLQVSMGSPVTQREMDWGRGEGVFLESDGENDDVQVAPSAVVIAPRSSTGGGGVSAVIATVATVSAPAAAAGAGAGAGAVVEGIREPAARTRPAAMDAVEDDVDADDL